MKGIKVLVSSTWKWYLRQQEERAGEYVQQHRKQWFHQRRWGSSHLQRTIIQFRVIVTKGWKRAGKKKDYQTSICAHILWLSRRKGKDIEIGFLVSKNAIIQVRIDRTHSQDNLRVIQEQCHLKGKITTHWGQQKRTQKRNFAFLFFPHSSKPHCLRPFEAIYKVFKICILMMLSSMKTHHRFLQSSYKEFYGVKEC